MHRPKEQTSEITDIVDMIRNGPVGHDSLMEQEVNFDAGFTPTPHRWKNVKVEWIDGKKYNVYS
jgi:hypothetical protein